jgi:hypothetical protein
MSMLSQVALLYNTIYVSCQVILLYMCPLTMDLRRSISHVALYYIYVFILLYMCPHTATCVLIPQATDARRCISQQPSATLFTSMFTTIFTTNILLYLLKAMDSRRCISQQPSDTRFLPPPSSFQIHYMFLHFLSSIFTTIFTAGDGFTPLHLAADFRHSCY